MVLSVWDDGNVEKSARTWRTADTLRGIASLSGEPGLHDITVYCLDTCPLALASLTTHGILQSYKDSPRV